MKHLFKTLILSAVLIPLLSACGSKGDIRYVAVQMSDKSQSWSIVDTQDGNVIADDEFAHQPSAIIDGMFFVENDKGLFDFYSVDDVNHTVAEGFKSVTYFNNGRAVVCKDDDGLSLIDKNGEVVAKLSSSIKNAGGFENDFAIVQNEEGKMGYINTDGEVAIKLAYDYAEPFSVDGYAVVAKKDADGTTAKYEIIDTKGEKLFGFSSEKYSKPISQFVNGSIAVVAGEEIVYLDENGGKMLKVGELANGEYGFYNGMTIYADGQSYGIKDEAGEKIIKAKYQGLFPIKNGNYIAKKDDRFMIIDSEGQKLSSDKYVAMAMINENRFFVQNTEGGNISIIDDQGNEIGQDSYKSVSWLKDPMKMASSGVVTPRSEAPAEEVASAAEEAAAEKVSDNVYGMSELKLEGTVAGARVVMYLDNQDGSLTGYYYYASMGPNNALQLSGGLTGGGDVSLSEYNTKRDIYSGAFEGFMTPDGHFTGEFQNQVSGKYSSFDLRVVNY